MLLKTGGCLLALALLAGCSTASKNIVSNYISPQQYSSYDCAQLAQESQRILVRVKQLGVQLDQAAANDQAIGVVGAVLFWPALFALGGTKQQEAEYARLKGEYEAAEQAAIAKKCASVSAAPAAKISPDMPQVDLDKDFAKVSDVQAVPFLNDRGREGYRHWLNQKSPKAFVLAPNGTWNATWGMTTGNGDESPEPLPRAMARCEKRAQGCRAYAVDQRVVWVP
jgi:hypothetical protein